jgi:hypothetical protein
MPSMITKQSKSNIQSAPEMRRRRVFLPKILLRVAIVACARTGLVTCRGLKGQTPSCSPRLLLAETVEPPNKDVSRVAPLQGRGCLCSRAGSRLRQSCSILEEGYKQTIASRRVVGAHSCGRQPWHPSRPRPMTQTN